MNLALREDRGLRPKPLDDPANVGPDVRRCYQHRRFAFACGFLEAFPDESDELGQARGLHGELPVVALTIDSAKACSHFADNAASGR